VQDGGAVVAVPLTGAVNAAVLHLRRRPAGRPQAAVG
jgi:hypothetical protein